MQLVVNSIVYGSKIIQMNFYNFDKFGLVHTFLSLTHRVYTMVYYTMGLHNTPKRWYRASQWFELGQWTRLWIIGYVFIKQCTVQWYGTHTVVMVNWHIEMLFSEMTRIRDFPHSPSLLHINIWYTYQNNP